MRCFHQLIFLVYYQYLMSMYRIFQLITPTTTWVFPFIFLFPIISHCFQLTNINLLYWPRLCLSFSPPLPLHPYAFYLYGKQRLKLIISQLRWVFLEQNFLREHLSLRKIVRVPLADIFIDSCWIFLLNCVWYKL